MAPAIDSDYDLFERNTVFVRLNSKFKFSMNHWSYNIVMIFLFSFIQTFLKMLKIAIELNYLM